jgi:flagellar capping protein FliD
MEAMRQSWSDDRLDDLQLEMRNGFARIENQIQQGTEQVERRIEQMDKRIDQIDTKIERLEARVEFGFGRLDGRIDSQARASNYLAGLLSTLVVALLAARVFL